MASSSSIDLLSHSFSSLVSSCSLGFSLDASLFAILILLEILVNLLSTVSSSQSSSNMFVSSSIILSASFFSVIVGQNRANRGSNSKNLYKMKTISMY